MIELVWNTSFKRAYRKRILKDPFLQKRFKTAIETFVEDPFNKKLRTHKRTGQLSGLWAFAVAYDCRVVFKFLDGQSAALLIDIGTHDEVY